MLRITLVLMGRLPPKLNDTSASPSLWLLVAPNVNVISEMSRRMARLEALSMRLVVVCRMVSTRCLWWTLLSSGLLFRSGRGWCMDLRCCIMILLVVLRHRTRG